MMWGEVFSALLMDGGGDGDGDGGVNSTVIFGKILDKVVIASICLSPILENGALGAGF